MPARKLRKALCQLLASSTKSRNRMGHKIGLNSGYKMQQMIRTSDTHIFSVCCAEPLRCVLLILTDGTGGVMLLTGDVVGADWRSGQPGAGGSGAGPVATTAQAIVQVYAARAFSWRGAFGVHTWIAVKADRCGSDTRSIISWGGGRVTPASGLAVGHDRPDRHWFGAEPEAPGSLGRGRCRWTIIIEKVDAAARAYPYQYEYGLWPGPNSNTFTSWVARQVPELRP